MTKILVADDDWQDLEPMLAKWLKEYELVFEDRADHVPEALARHPDVDLVLLDLHFHKQVVQGRDVVRTLKQSHSSVPVIVLSDAADIHLAQQLKEENKNQHYFKKEDLKHSNPEFTSRIKTAVEAHIRHKSILALRVTFADRTRQAIIGDVCLKLTTMQYALYRTVAQAAQEQWFGVGPQGFGGVGWIAFSDFFSPATKPAQNFVDLWRGPNLIAAAEKFYDILVEAGNPKRSEDNRDYYRDKIRKLLSPCLPKINQELKRALMDPRAFERFKIYQEPRWQGTKRVSTFGLLLDVNAIKNQK